MSLDLNKCSPQLRDKILKQIANEDSIKASGADPKQAVCDKPLGKNEGEKRNTESVSGRSKVSITSFRRRLCDPDGLCGKYALDCCRYAGFLRDDTAAEISYSISQVKVKTKEEERTEITIRPEFDAPNHPPQILTP